MRKVHEKSIILGIGIGMIITAITGMIFSAGTQKELSKEEIISRAKGYGMIEKAKLIDNENDSTANTSSVANTTTAETTLANSTVAANSGIANSTSADTTTPVKATTAANERNIIIEIKDGYKSQQVVDELLEKGVITRGEDFMAVLDSNKASTKISIGTFKFKTNEDLEYIVKTICNIK